MCPGTVPSNKAVVEEDRLWARQAIQNTLLISGRYHLASGDEHPCKFRCVTVDRGEVITSIIGNPGEIIICYLDRVGIITGVIEDTIPGGMSVNFTISQARHSRILARLERHAAREFEHIELRREARIVPNHKNVSIKTSDNYHIPSEIIDISLSGASLILESKKRPSIGQTVIIGRRKARVVRLINDGIAVQFEVAFRAEDFGPNIIL